jgi:putative phosphoesterase
MRIGLISDTHIPLNAEKLPLQLPSVFTGVELILHAGDIYLTSVLDELGVLAPVLAAYGDGDARIGTKMGVDLRLKKSHTINVDGVYIGLVHEIRFPGVSLEKVFDCPVDIVVRGHSHEASIETHQGVTVVNPGSATLPNHQLNKAGTVALLDIVRRKVNARIVQLDCEWGNKQGGG